MQLHEHYDLRAISMGRHTQLYERCSLGAIPTSGVSSQCPDTGIQLLCNLIKNVCFIVRQLPLAHQLSYKQNFWIPVGFVASLLMKG
ncbi:hypothetical protein OZD68_01780 [Wolbachia endosymbiont of Drosophila bicornuta]|uniref:hypothetical protein n=1 Tax=Wolbachia endosymbiont of Drosophila bicornuta TaxID=375918 RepID=UPI0023A916FD|nr:hypothetical protein [Wolbachia endosymbiont of Drosophila bicornuta]MDE5056329.1 hypothetical protein [Wolbachia endosymbiont of Drosophila bicornuta]